MDDIFDLIAYRDKRVVLEMRNLSDLAREAMSLLAGDVTFAATEVKRNVEYAVALIRERPYLSAQQQEEVRRLLIAYMRSVGQRLDQHAAFCGTTISGTDPHLLR